MTLTSTSLGWVDLPNINVTIISGYYYWLGFNDSAVSDVKTSGSAGQCEYRSLSGVLQTMSVPDFFGSYSVMLIIRVSLLTVLQVQGQVPQRLEN